MRYTRPFAVLACCTVLLVGCDIFEVKNPGQILDEDLNQRLVMNALVTGMSADLSVVYDDLAFIVARLSDELEASGSYFLSTRARYGIIDHDDTDFYWEGLHQARFVAENGIERMQTVLGDEFDGNVLSVRAYLYGGVANRALGENFCQVTYDNGPAQEPTAAFQRAIGLLNEAIRQAELAGEDDLLNAAYGVRAQAYVGVGDWAKAVADAQKVPTDFVYLARYDSNSGRESNEIYDETHQRFESSAYLTVAGTQNPMDPRAPFTDCRTSSDCSTDIGADGSTPHLRQEKYTGLGSDIPLTKGTEMRLIEAEAALRNNQLGPAMDAINEARAEYGLGTISATTVGAIGDADDDDAWSILDRERHLTLWLEARRLFDLRRWDHPFIDGGTIVYPGEKPRAACLPIADSECQTNPNLSC